MKDIYDEAKEELQSYIEEYGIDYYATDHFPKTIKALERAKKVEELVKFYEVLVHDYEQLLETKDNKGWSLLRFHIIELKRIIDKKLEELK